MSVVSHGNIGLYCNFTVLYIFFMPKLNIAAICAAVAVSAVAGAAIAGAAVAGACFKDLRKIQNETVGQNKY